MGHSNWSFQGTGYRIRWDASLATPSLDWGDLLQMPSLFPLIAAAPAHATGGPPLQRLPAKARKRFLRWNPSGTLQGLDPSSPPVFQDTALFISSSAEDRSPALSWKLECLPDRILVSAEVENRTADDLLLHSLAPLAGSVRFPEGPDSRWRFFKMGSNTTMPTGSVSLAGSERNLGIRILPTRLIPGPAKRMILLPDESVSFRRGVFSSQWFTLLVHQDSGAAMLLGFTGVRRHFSTLRLDTSAGCFQAAALADGCTLGPGKRFACHPLVILFGSSPFDCIDRYLEEIAGSETPRFRSASLWGSWYTGFYDRFQWDDLRDNMEAAGGAPQKIEYFQLDDGYQTAVGDWKETLPCLPEGLEGFANRVREAGMKPGVWVAPFAVGRDARVCREHPEWLVRGPSGKPVRAGFMAGRFRLRPYYALDLTRAAVLDWLRDLFQTLAGWGFELFKLDFLAAGTVPGTRERRELTAAQAYHNGLAAIREAVGDRPLMGALAPQLCGLGIMDIQRVSTDSSFGGNSWESSLQRWTGDSVTPGVRNNLRNNFTRFFLDERLWLNDCDAVLCGGLSPAEQKTHMAVNLLLGGVFQVGFDLRKDGYPWESIGRLRAFRPWFRVVPDLFETEFPEEAMIGAGNSRGEDVLLYLTVNPDNHPKRKMVRDPSAFFPEWEVQWEQALDVWDGAPFHARPGDTHTLPPRDSRLLEIPLRRK